MVGLDRAVLGGHVGAFHQRQQIALHAFATDIATAGAGFAALGHLVDLIDEHDAVLLARFDGRGAHIVFVDQFARFFFDQQRARCLDGELALLGFAAAQIGKHLAQLLAHFFHARRGHDVHAGVHRHFQFDLALVQLAVAQHATELDAGVVILRGGLVARRFRIKPDTGRATWQQCVQDAVFGTLFGLVAHAHLGLLAIQLDGGIGQVADDLLHILAHIPHFGEARGFDLDERRVGQCRQAPCDLGLAHTGRADHQDVLGHHFVAQFFRQLHAAPAVTQRDGNRALGVVLTNDMTVELLHDFARSHGGGIDIRH